MIWMYNIKNVAKRLLFRLPENRLSSFRGIIKKKSSRLKLDFYTLFLPKYYFLFMTFSEAFIIASAFKPYFSISCSGVPDSPNVSSVATNS